MITGDATLVWFRGAPLLQGRQHPFWGCQQVGLLQQKLSSEWERAGRTGVGADHIDHQAIVLRPRQRSLRLPLILPLVVTLVLMVRNEVLHRANSRTKSFSVVKRGQD